MAPAHPHSYSDVLPEIISNLCGRLEEFENSTSSCHVFTGFDGFIDKIQKVVKSKKEQQNIFFSSIKEYSGYLANLSGRSGQVEIITKEVKAGGNAPILSNALALLGIKNYCVGSLGYPEVSSVFNTLNSLVQKIPVAAPGESQALEFEDGKIILSELGTFKDYNWNTIRNKIDLRELIINVNECKLFALVDWANIPYASDIWEGFLQEIIVPSGKRDSFFLFDLCDPSKKQPGEIDEVLSLISRFSGYGRVTLGMNENEAIKIWLALQKDRQRNPDVPLPAIWQIGNFIYQQMNIDTLLIHPIDRTLVFQHENEIEAPGRLVLKPRISTGGGDNLNAGYSLGLLMGVDVHHCMVLGMAASGAYVQNGQSATIPDLIQYLKIWNHELKHQPISSRL